MTRNVTWIDFFSEQSYRYKEIFIFSSPTFFENHDYLATMVLENIIMLSFSSVVINLWGMTPLGFK